MCGFAGVINSPKIFSESQVRDIASIVSFRGPDHTGIRIFDNKYCPIQKGNNVFFFNRLAILDLESRSNQPFEDDRYLLLFNGEIYNYLEIKKDLESFGFVFKTTSDTEVVFFALIKWGREALRRFNGMFSLFFLNKVSQSYLLSRDRMGIKPLYYKQEGASLLFSSEIDSILRFGYEKNHIRFESISLFLSLQYIPTPFSIYNNIFKLPPGCYLEGDINQLSSGPVKYNVYWDAYACAQTSPNSSKNNLVDLLIASIGRQLHSDVPIGCFLSSGVDSSLIAAIINSSYNNGNQYNFFTVSFGEESSHDESTDASDFLSKFYNPFLYHHKLVLSPTICANAVLKLYAITDEPFGDPAYFLNYTISHEARKHVTVVLSGDGADELFGGYIRYGLWEKRMQSAKLYRYIYNANILMPNISLKERWKRRFNADPISYYFQIMSVPGLNGYETIIDSDLWWKEGIKSVIHRKDLPSMIDIKTYLPDCMLFKVDRSSMGASLEVRVPYLDNEIIDFALRTPYSQKKGNYGLKAQLKEILIELAPHYDLHRPKKGFNFPLVSWLRNKWRDIVYDAISANNLENMGISKLYCNNTLNEFYGNGRDSSAISLWYLFNLSLWFLEKKRHLV